MVMGYEGYRDHVYLDGGGVPTYCWGETQNPQPGKKYTKVECEAEFQPRINEFAAGVDGCLTVRVNDKVAAAYIDFAYNVGLAAFCSSTLLRLTNAGKGQAACEQLPRWNKDNGKIVRGLTIRRGDEQGLCLDGVMEGV